MRVTSLVSIIDLPFDISALMKFVNRLHILSTVGYVSFVYEVKYYCFKFKAQYMRFTSQVFTFVVVNAGEISARLSFHSSSRKINGFLANNFAFSLLYYWKINHKKYIWISVSSEKKRNSNAKNLFTLVLLIWKCLNFPTKISFTKDGSRTINSGIRWVKIPTNDALPRNWLY